MAAMTGFAARLAPETLPLALGVVRRLCPIFNKTDEPLERPGDLRLSQDYQVGMLLG